MLYLGGVHNRDGRNTPQIMHVLRNARQTWAMLRSFWKHFKFNMLFDFLGISHRVNELRNVVRDCGRKIDPNLFLRTE